MDRTIDYGSIDMGSSPIKDTKINIPQKLKWL